MKHEKNDREIEEAIIKEISAFSSTRNWKCGLRQKYLYKKMYDQGYSRDQIEKIIKNLEREGVIYTTWSHSKPYWLLTSRYRRKADLINSTV